jgi:hypothetical protein
VLFSYPASGWIGDVLTPEGKMWQNIEKLRAQDGYCPKKMPENVYQ